MAGTAIMSLMWASPPVRELTDALVRRGEARRAFVANDPPCAYGQALDCSHSSQCPRCGVTLHC